MHGSEKKETLTNTVRAILCARLLKAEKREPSAICYLLELVTASLLLRP